VTPATLFAVLLHCCPSVLGWTAIVRSNRQGSRWDAQPLTVKA
jgi:hypothetical protein